MATNSNIVSIYSKSFAGQNLFEISLVKDNDPQLPFYKPKFFFFISMTPGAKTDQGGRTFNRNGRVTLKCDSEKVLALAESMAFWARGQGAFGKFSIYAESSKSQSGGSGKKACFAGEYMKPGRGDNDPPERQITLSFKIDQARPFGNFFPPAEALAIANIIRKIAEKSIDMDLECRQIQVGNVTQAPMGQPTEQNNRPPIQQNNRPPIYNDPPEFDNPPFEDDQYPSGPVNGNTTDSVKQNFEQALTSPQNSTPPIAKPPFIEDAPF